MTTIEPEVSLLWSTPDPLKMIELSGRTCYKSEDKITEDSANKFCVMVSQKGHESVLEHVSISFRIICDRAISHELCRHRLTSISQESTRYVNYTKDRHGAGDIKFILPVGLSVAQRLLFQHGYEVSEKAYNDAIAAGCTPQQARALLPLGLKTELVVTANAREWLHILKLRLDKSAHPDMRIVARLLHTQLEHILPAIFDTEELNKLRE
jgi:thymidylate synthase (FAD)